MPPIVPLPRFNILTSGRAGEGGLHLRPLEESVNASHTREMAPGDPMKLIHWKTTARTAKFHVRQADDIPGDDWWILLDLHDASQVGKDWDSTEEHGVILASSLIAQGLNQDRSVGLAINGEAPAWHVPRRNEHQQRGLLKSLATASQSGMDLKEYLRRTGGSFGSRSSLLIITACAEAEWTASLLPLLWRGVMPTVFLFDVNTFGGAANTRELATALQSFGVPCNIIPKDLLDKPQSRPGHEGEWEWRISGTGRAVALRKPVADWRRLA
jgi:uncharacterized protein (DUF58 family)